jgi:hypothetical protein
METMTKINRPLFILAAIAAGAFFTSAMPCRAEKVQSCPGTTDQGGVHCTLTEAKVVNGVLFCGYDCYTVPKAAAAAAAMGAIEARSSGAYAGLNLNDPASVKKVNAALRKTHADRAAYAKAHGIKLNRKEYKHKVGTGTVEKTGATEKK